jgi:hypothetical protein
MIAIICQILHLGVKLIRVYGQGVFIPVVNLMVVQYRHRLVGLVHNVKTNPEQGCTDDQHDDCQPFYPDYHSYTSS